MIRKDLHHLEELEDQIGFSAVVSFDGMVWNEFYGDEGAVVGIWVRGSNLRGYFDCLSQHLDHEKEEILVAGRFYSTE